MTFSSSGGISINSDYWSLSLWFRKTESWPNDLQLPVAIVKDSQGWSHSGLLFSVEERNLILNIPAIVAPGKSCQVELFEPNWKSLGRMNFTMPIDAPAKCDWVPKPLPSKSLDSELEVTLDQVVVGESDLAWTSSYHCPHIPTFQIIPQLRVQENSQPTEQWTLCDDDWWSLRTHVAPNRNAIGERSGLAPCRLSPHDPVWKLELALCRKNSALPADQVAEFECPVPEDHQVSNVGEDRLLNGVTVRLIGVAGAGQTTLSGAGVRGMVGKQKFEFLDRSKRPVRLESQSISDRQPVNWTPVSDPESTFPLGLLQPANVTLTMDQPVPALLFSVSPWTHQHLELDVCDQDGRKLAGQKFRWFDAAVWVPTESMKGIQSLRIRASLQNPRRFEFFVAPPRQAILNLVENAPDERGASAQVPADSR
jgi:hypothetical protein